jgi:hypothetical protein
VSAVTDVADFAMNAIERYAPDIEVPPPAVMDQVRRNIEAQVALLTEFGAVTVEELAKLAGSKAKRPNVTVDNWRRAHRIITVRFRDQTMVPGFLLLETGQPDPTAQPAISQLAEYGASDWQAALWWTAAAPALDDQRPVDVLMQARDGSDVATDAKTKLVGAARRPRDWF